MGRRSAGKHLETQNACNAQSTDSDLMGAWGPSAALGLFIYPELQKGSSRMKKGVVRCYWTDILPVFVSVSSLVRAERYTLEERLNGSWEVGRQKVRGLTWFLSFSGLRESARQVYLSLLDAEI